MPEPVITFTRSEFVSLVQKIQDLALMGAFIFIKDMTGEIVGDTDAEKRNKSGKSAYVEGASVGLHHMQQ